jgi:CelD/BcsL family acetyltransferase involved in cellulose biosynthesis
VAGSTLVVHAGDVVGILTHRDKSYEHYSLGTRLMDLSFQWAKQSGFRRYDLGTAGPAGTLTYKSRWAPISSQRWALLEFCPEFHYRLRQFRGYGSAVRRLLGHNRLARSVFRRLPSGIRHAVAALRGGR